MKNRYSVIFLLAIVAMMSVPAAGEGGPCYLIKRDGANFEVLKADSTGTINFNNSEWYTPHTFTVYETSCAPLPWDVNEDGVTDIFDAKLVKNQLDGDPTPCPRCDVTGSDGVNPFDLVAVIENMD